MSMATARPTRQISARCSRPGARAVKRRYFFSPRRQPESHDSPRGWPERTKAADANRRFAPPRVASAQITAYLGPRGFTPREADQSERKRRTRTEGSPRRKSRALKPRLISAPEDSLRGRPTRASESGYLKRSFSSPRVASAQTRALMLVAVAAAAAPSGEIHAKASESGGREPKVRPAASRERSNTSAQESPATSQPLR
jgi:hypothetical protein